MASITNPADAIRSAVTSIQTCTPTISAILKDLLLGNEKEPSNSKSTTKPQSAKPNATSRSKTAASTKRTPAAAKLQVARNEDSKPDALGAKEKAVLATHIINATLKTLGDAAKSPAPVLRSPAKGQKPSSRGTLRRSSSMPMTPLQPRSLNRVSTSPVDSGKICKSPITTAPASSGCLATVECARVAFATLRTLSSAGQVVLPPLQLETGMSSFINKLIALHMYEPALKELRLLKRRLESFGTGGSSKKSRGGGASSESASASPTFSDLFDYSSTAASGAALNLIITGQLQALRIIYGLKKLSHLNTALPFLRASCPCSPLALALQSLKEDKCDTSKCAKQLDNLAQTLLSLTPSISARDDSIATEPRLSPSPETALEIQSLALLARLHSWSLSGHKGDVDKDILFPLSRCVAAFTRRATTGSSAILATANLAFCQVWEKVEVVGLRPSETSKSPLASLYQSLGTVAREAGNYKDAIKWTKKVKSSTNANEDSAARCCSVAAQLLALSLKHSTDADPSLIAEVLEGLQGSLSGSATELDDLLSSINLLRKVTTSVLLGEGRPKKDKTPIQEQLESLLLQLPRFALRWLGKPPPAGSSPKDLLRFEQRRQLLSNSLHHILDSALMLTKILLDGGKLAWDLMDPTLQDSLMVLENMGDVAFVNMKSNPAASYHVKISHFYYQQHIAFRQSSDTKDVLSLRALKRSIDAVKQRSDAEQVKAQLVAKQERLAELCRASGRKDDAADTLRSIRDGLVREEIVPDITAALTTQGIIEAWKLSPKVEALSRTVCHLAKVESTPCDWTWLLAGFDKATALEHDLYFVYSAESRNRKHLTPGGPFVDRILQAFEATVNPIRKLRTLLQLLVVNLGSTEGVASWLEEVKALLTAIDGTTCAEDSALSCYLPHLQGLASCLICLFEGALELTTINRAISAWLVMVEQCQSAGDLHKFVDNPPQLITTIQSLSDFARMKGLDSLLASILQLSARVCELAATNTPELQVSQNAALCLQHLTVGQSSKIGVILESSQQYIHQKDVAPETIAYFNLCSAEYYMAIGSFDRAEQSLTDAHQCATTQPGKHGKGSRLSRKVMMAYASFLHSALALEKGQSHNALNHAKNAVRILYHDWAKLEAQREVLEEQVDESAQPEISEDDSSFNNSSTAKSESSRANTGPEFWAMVHPLFRFTLRLSATYAHVGMYQETIYYAEQAQKIANSMGAAAYICQSKAWLASVFRTAGKTDEALRLATEVQQELSILEPTCATIDMICQLSHVFRDNADYSTEANLMNIANAMLKNLNGSILESSTIDIEAKMEKLSVEEKPTRKATTTRQTKARTTTARKTVAKKTVPPKVKPAVEIKAPADSIDIQLSFLEASLLQQQSSSLLDQKEWGPAITTLQTAYELSKLSADITQQRLLMAVAFIGQSLEQMGHDSVFSVIQDSTLSFPAIAASLKDKANPDRASPLKASPPRKGRSAAASSPKFIETLRQAQDFLIEAHSIATLNGDGRLVYRIAALLQNVAILLSTASSSKASGTGHPAHATCSVELARNLVWRRESKTLQVDGDKAGKAEWPLLLEATDNRRTSFGFSIDMNRFQREYVDIIPDSWNVVSLSLSDNKHDLCITKLQAGHSPFAIRLPLERASSRDADTEVFNFHQGHAELLDIIQAANRTCHDARDMTVKGAKSAWWAEREELDNRMKEALENIEQTWLGGFRGIFAQCHRRSDLLARFQKSFQNILDKHLPSRQQARGKRTKVSATTRVSLDPRILDLFIGLGDASAPECDLDEPLLDLLYFVVDILQFHGERNAYDEIDFDSMVVETFDALHSYHSAAKSSKDGNEVHTILVLDKSLHIFPWESLPCMQGLAVSRIPSLAYLRRAILEQRNPRIKSTEQSPEDNAAAAGPATRDGHHIAAHSGTYILNPSTDLTSTQAKFAGPLASLPPAWTSIEGRAPSEAEFAAALEKRDLLLYFGHGSGAQYIRSRTVRRLGKCRSVALLMGCSSASLADVGEFECYGTVWNYMLAGSPAVVGTLWDVTDRDIDRYAGRVFEEWGLMPRGTFGGGDDEKSAAGVAGKGKGKGRSGSSSSSGSSKKSKSSAAAVEDETIEAGGEGVASSPSLVEAVAKARDACRFRYLTAAAVVVYGIPVYISK
ncbi:peptidase family C50 [Xylariales sp. PMI_506]|nr:peptidase family C50 [Xylariales sp. PMI_506]